jgi:hypothetical protein
MDQPAVTKNQAKLQVGTPPQGLAALELYIPNPMKRPNKLNKASMPSAAMTPAQMAPHETRATVSFRRTAGRLKYSWVAQDGGAGS